MTNFNQAWAKIIAKAWGDEAFKEELFDHPEAICQQFGLELPPGAKLVVHESTAEELHLSLPPKPEGELSEERLEELAAGALCPLALCGAAG